jgi:hypothetical protein
MKEARDGKPPITGSWTALYLLLAGMLLVMIVFLYLFTKHFE